MVAVGKLTAMPQVTVSLVRWLAEYQVVRRYLTLDTQCLHRDFLPSVCLELSGSDPFDDADIAGDLGRSIFFSENLVDF